MKQLDEIEKKIRIHRLKRLKWTAVTVGICLAAVITYYVFMQHKSYTDYRVTEEIARTDTPATHYLSYGDGFLKYSNDGASYVNVNSDVIWNQSYEMENPMVAVCESYAAVADRQGDKIYVMNDEGLQGEVTVSMPISRIDVASQGDGGSADGRERNRVSGFIWQERGIAGGRGDSCGERRNADGHCPV